jgi:hypothetical protein
MGKLFAFVFVLCVIVGAALFVPVGGRTFWSRAVERGIPQAAARNVAHGLRAGWDWVMAERKVETPRRPVRRVPAAPAHAVAKAGPVRAAPVRPSPPPAQPPSSPVTRVAAAPRPTRDGIVAQPKEKLHEDDRRELDRLVATQR